MATVLKITNKEKLWYTAKNKIEVKTPLGSKLIDKLWYNGLADVYMLTFENSKSESYSISCTEYHKFKRIDGSWVQAIDMVAGYMFDCDWKFVSINKLKHKQPTFDIEVPEEHCYILESGIVSHNSSALICSSVSQGIEPIYKNAYVQNTAAGKMDRVNPSLLKVMKEKDIYSEETVKDIIANNGSVQHVEWLTEEEKEVFKTAFEINQLVILRLASARQRFIDQGQSINLFFSSDESEEYISEVHKTAFLDPYIKGLYYIRSESGVNVSKDACLACHG